MCGQHEPGGRNEAMHGLQLSSSKHTAFAAFHLARGIDVRVSTPGTIVKAVK